MSYHGNPAAEGIAAARKDAAREALYADLEQPDYGDTFYTGRQITDMLRDGQTEAAFERMARCISLHELCGNYIKARIIRNLRTRVLKLFM